MLCKIKKELPQNNTDGSASYQIVVNKYDKSGNLVETKSKQSVLVWRRVEIIYEKNCEQDNEKREILKGKKVAIIGGGPAGLTSAAFLAKDGVRSYNFWKV